MAQRWIVTTDECAELFKCTVQTVNQWIRDGLPVVKRGRKGGGRTSQIDVRDAIAWYVEYDALDAEKTRLTREQADKQALDNAVRRGELGEIAAWRSELETVFGEIRAQLLAIPTKEAPQLDGNVNQRKERLEGVVRQILSRLAAYQPGGAAAAHAPRDRRGRRGAQSAAEADDLGVGRPLPKAVARDKRRAR